jgi:hypothetical protein
MEGNTIYRPLTAREVAGFLGIHPNTVKKIPANDLPYFTMGSRGDRKYLVEDVEEYINKRRVGKNGYRPQLYST